MFDPFLSDYRPENSRVYMPQAVFGEIGGMKSLADVQDLLTSVRYRMTQLASALGQVNPLTVKDQAKFAALLIDAGNLKTRVSSADANASSALSYAGVGGPIMLATIPAQSAYDALLKAIKQGYPPDGAQVRRGDYDDIVNRVRQVGGVSVDLSQMPQPRASDPDRTFINATAPIAHAVDAAAGAAKALADDAARQGKDAFDFYRWVEAHKTEIGIAGGILVILMFWHLAPSILPAAKTAGKAFILA